MFFYLHDITTDCNEIIRHCKLWNVSCGEKSKKKKVKIRTQNEKIVEKNIHVWYQTYKKKHLLELGRNSECK